MSAEQRQALSERMKAKWASLSPEEHAAAVEKFRDPLKSEHAHEQLTKFWAGCTGEARAKRCAHLTNPEAQAKSHAAQRTPEFLAKRAAWGKAAWERKTPEERAAAVEKRRETMRLKRIARGLPPVAPRKSHAKLSPEERLAVQRASMARFWENHQEIRERAAAKRAEREGLRQARAEERAMRLALLESKPRKRRKWKRKSLTKKQWREFHDKIHCKPVIATPKKGGKPLRFGSARNAARTLLARGVTKNALGAQQKISLVCNGYRKSAFGYYWDFLHRGRPMTLETRKERN